MYICICTYACIYIYIYIYVSILIWSRGHSPVNRVDIAIARNPEGGWDDHSTPVCGDKQIYETVQ